MGDGSVQRYGLILCTAPATFSLPPPPPRLHNESKGGGCSRGGRKTNSFSLPDIVRLMNVLMIRYRLECTIHLKRRQNQKIEYLIYIKHCSMPLLRTIVIPYMSPSMYYKINGK